jgi:hypothetical protein
VVDVVDGPGCGLAAGGPEPAAETEASAPVHSPASTVRATTTPSTVDGRRRRARPTRRSFPQRGAVERGRPPLGH